MRRFLFFVLLSQAAWGQHDFELPRRRPDGMPLSIQVFGVEVREPLVVARLPHDPTSFTQGLCFDNQGRLFESCGGYQNSCLRQLDPETGKVLRQSNLSREYWAEGCCPIGPELLLLTWQNRRFFFFDQETLTVQSQLEYFGEGWGVSPWQDQLALSDGSDTLQFFNPKPWKKTREIQVSESGRKVDLLNELEAVGPNLLCNVWPSDYIAVIDPEDGRIDHWLSGHNLLSHNEQNKSDVLNGIAYDPARRQLYLTGKFWPWIFIVRGG